MAMFKSYAKLLEGKGFDYIIVESEKKNNLLRKDKTTWKGYVLKGYHEYWELNEDLTI